MAYQVHFSLSREKWYVEESQYEMFPKLTLKTVMLLRNFNGNKNIQKPQKHTHYKSVQGAK